ncbi:MAG: endonuclease/exonuclease/phosphatase family protein [Cyclobacteriaceae bacterium]|nr:endonuclease/exonuclease/phosphatase family protein [Cyclobacteriaceae bacterium]
MIGPGYAILFFFLVVTFMPYPASGQAIRIMSYNIRFDNPADGLNSWGNRREFLAGQVQSADPDVLAIQESLPNQVEFLSTKLNGYGHAGQGRDEGGQGESTTIFFRQSRFDLKEVNQFWLSESPDQLSRGWDAAIRRICTYVLLFDKQLNRSILIFNTHFDHIGHQARIKSAELILRKIKESNAQGLPVILTGDFNATPDSAPIQLLQKEMSDCRLIATSKSMAAQGSFNAFDTAKPATQLIDHIFVTSGVTVATYAVLVATQDGKYPSDHFPVVVDIALPK